MDLTTCKKCNRICSVRDKTCPYCGAALSPGAPSSDGEQQSQFRTAVFGFFAGFLVLFALIFALLQKQAVNNAPTDDVQLQNCKETACPVGTRGVTASIGSEPYYTCNSGELSDYANYALSVSLAQAQVGGPPQKITGKGEPDIQGDAKDLLDRYRAKAGVTTFEEAMAKCYKGIGRQNVSVLYYPEQGDSLYAASEKNSEDKFWLPKSKLYKSP